MRGLKLINSKENVNMFYKYKMPFCGYKRYCNPNEKLMNLK